MAEKRTPQETYKETVFKGSGQEFWGRTYVGDVRIATDHCFLYIETMVFGGELDGKEERYTTEEEARLGHERMVERVRASEAKQ